jgi:AraC family transcriptional regulator, melibiose operon regulatory protein
MPQKTFDPFRKDFAPYGFACDQWVMRPMARADRHNEIEINFPPNRPLTYLIGGQRHVAPRGQLSVFWAATPHQIIEYSEPSVYFVATIPLAWFLMWRLPQQLTQRVLAGELVCAPDNSQAAADERVFTRWVQDFRCATPELMRAVSLELEARLRRLAVACGEATQTAPSPLAGRRWEEMTKIEQMAAWMAQHYTEQVSLEDIGRAVDLHPNYAAGLYRKAFGTTLNASLQSYRVAHAQRLLVVSDTKILDVALQAGFNSLSRFNVAFKRACGCTPREYRQRHAL